MKDVFKFDFLNIFTAIHIFTRVKWKMELFVNGICFDFKNWRTRTTISFGLKTSGGTFA